MKIAILGGGMIGESLLSGLRRAGSVAADVVVAERNGPRAADLGDRFGVELASPAHAVRKADVVVVAVKPADVGELLADIASALPAGAVLISLAAGVTLRTLEEALPPDTPVIRVMPNTPMRVGEAVCALSPGSSATDEDLARAEALLTAVGSTVRVPESLQDAVTAISGSGPAYFLYVIEALIDAGVELGLPRDTAVELVAQTAYGTALLLRTSKESPAVLREAVTSPGGTTARGLRALDEGGARAALATAARAAYDRSRELGR